MSRNIGGRDDPQGRRHPDGDDRAGPHPPPDPGPLERRGRGHERHRPGPSGRRGPGRCRGLRHRSGADPLRRGQGGGDLLLGPGARGAAARLHRRQEARLLREAAGDQRGRGAQGDGGRGRLRRAPRPGRVHAPLRRRLPPAEAGARRWLASCEAGVASLPERPSTVVRDQHGVRQSVPEDWRERFVDAYDQEFREWIVAAAQGSAVGPSTWDSYAATLVADAALRAVDSGNIERITMREKPALYRTPDAPAA